MSPTSLTRLRSPRTIAVAGSLIAAVVAVGCASDSTSPFANATPQLSFTATNTSGASADVAPASAIIVGTHTLDLTNIGLTITRAELKRATTDVCPGDDDGDDHDRGDDHPRAAGNNSNDNCGELKVGATTLDISVNGSAATIPTNAIRAGSYRELELTVNTVQLKGKFDTTAFNITVPVSARAEFEFDPPLVVNDSSPASLTVNLPLAAWFTNPDGSLVDPSQLATNPTLAAQVKARILQSLRAIEDRDHDGRDDHGRDGHGGHGDNSGPGNSGKGNGGNSGPG
ncbi:MAG TPA: hypothetical protein VGM82_00610 [Gemmatimonadaceae bacterium]